MLQEELSVLRTALYFLGNSFRGRGMPRKDRAAPGSACLHTGSLKAHRAFAVAFFGDKRGIAKKELSLPHPCRGFCNLQKIKVVTLSLKSVNDRDQT